MNILKKRRLAREWQHIQDVKGKKFYKGKELKIGQKGVLNKFCDYCEWYLTVCKKSMRYHPEIPACMVAGRPIKFKPKAGITLDDLGKAGFDVNVMRRMKQGGSAIKPVGVPLKEAQLTKLGKHKKSFLDSLKEK